MVPSTTFAQASAAERSAMISPLSALLVRSSSRNCSPAFSSRSTITGIAPSGGAKGIGAAIVRGCCAEGAIPVIVDRDENAGEQLRDELRTSRAESGLIIADLSAPEACANVVDGTIQKLGRLDALVNNAGVNDGVGLEHGSPEKFVASL